MKTEILYGVHPVTEALKVGRRAFYEVFTTQTGRAGRSDSALAQAERRRIPIRRLTGSKLEDMAGTRAHQGIALRVGLYPFETPADILGGGTPEDPVSFILLLDGVLDPHNLGALIRTALCAGVSGVIIPKDRSARPTPAVSRISAGALEHIRLVQVTNLVRTIKDLRKKGLWVFGLDPGAALSIYQGDMTGPVAIVIGGEEKGIRRLVRDSCDQMVAIPQKGPLDSLNAAVAGGLVMYEAVRQRSGGK